jgi:hypothetical protein
VKTRPVVAVFTPFRREKTTSGFFLVFENPAQPFATRRKSRAAVRERRTLKTSTLVEPENQRLLTNGAASAEKHIVAP